jgi:hypothetical protein
MIETRLIEHGQNAGLFGTAPDHDRFTDAATWAARLLAESPRPPLLRPVRKRKSGWLSLLESRRRPARLPAPTDARGWARRLLQGA